MVNRARRQHWETAVSMQRLNAFVRWQILRAVRQRLGLDPASMLPARPPPRDVEGQPWPKLPPPDDPRWVYDHPDNIVGRAGSRMNLTLVGPPPAPFTPPPRKRIPAGPLCELARMVAQARRADGHLADAEEIERLVEALDGRGNLPSK